MAAQRSDSVSLLWLTVNKCMQYEEISRLRPSVTHIPTRTISPTQAPSAQTYRIYWKLLCIPILATCAPIANQPGRNITNDGCEIFSLGKNTFYPHAVFD